jgi:hypothetical protein
MRVDHHEEYPATPMGRPGEYIWLDGTMSLQLIFTPALSRPNLLAVPVAAALRDLPDAAEVEVAEIDPALADTAAFCERYGISLAESAGRMWIVLPARLPRS